MSHYFHGELSIYNNGFISDEKYHRGSTDIAEDYYVPICHAINSHDYLVAEVERLRGAIESVISTSGALALKAPTSDWGDGFKECALTTSNALKEIIDSQNK